jgi:hypothetical protein
VHQLVSRFSGRITLPDGACVIVDDLLGTVEDHFGKW